MGRGSKNFGVIRPKEIKECDKVSVLELDLKYFESKAQAMKSLIQIAN